MADTEISLDRLTGEERAILAAPYPGFAAFEIAARRDKVTGGTPKGCDA